jgi:hypothetical protein
MKSMDLAASQNEQMKYYLIDPHARDFFPEGRSVTREAFFSCRSKLP